ncbi:hypothetical protein GR927_24400 [Mycolicibacterium sp. 3033]|nr:hypothetical protein [Mycolicibacterium aurantiacum]
MIEVKPQAVQFFVTPGYGEMLRTELHYSQAVRIGDRVEISGQGGWDDHLNFPESVDDEIIRAFDNIHRTLHAAGSSWREVVHVNSYHVVGDPAAFDAHNAVMVEQMRRWMPDHAPIWTQTGVPTLAAPGMRIEIRVTAIDQPSV